MSQWTCSILDFSSLSPLQSQLSCRARPFRRGPSGRWVGLPSRRSVEPGRSEVEPGEEPGMWPSRDLLLLSRFAFYRTRHFRSVATSQSHLLNSCTNLKISPWRNFLHNRLNVCCSRPSNARILAFTTLECFRKVSGKILCPSGDSITLTTRRPPAALAFFALGFTQFASDVRGKLALSLRIQQFFSDASAPTQHSACCT
jgi:hypothetical protein